MNKDKRLSANDNAKLTILLTKIVKQVEYLHDDMGESGQGNVIFDLVKKIEDVIDELPSNIELSELETKWLNRFKKYLSDHKHDYVCSWWLRCEYESEKISTAKINYILSKLVNKDILKKETTRSYTKFSLAPTL